MEWLNQINGVIEYLETNLEQKVDYGQAAKIACCSEYHLTRMFTSIAGVSMSEYVRRRRLTKAAYEIQNSAVRVIDIALKYGYESADAFSRAFLKMHGVRPSEARRQGMMLRAYPRLSIEMTVKGEAAIAYRIEEVVDDLLIVGLKYSVAVDQADSRIPMLWQNLAQLGILGGFDQVAVSCGYDQLDGLLGVYEKAAKDFAYTIGVRLEKSQEESVLSNIEKVMAGAGASKSVDLQSGRSLTIPKGRWIVFTDLSEVRKRLFDEWIPTLGYTLADKPFIECVKGTPDDMEASLWVPIL